MIHYEVIHKYGWIRLVASNDEWAREEVRNMGKLWEPRILRIEKTVIPLEGGHDA